MHANAATVDRPVAAHSRRTQAALAATLVLVGLVMALVSSLGAPLIPTIAGANHVSISTAQWMLTATLLSGAVASPIMGQLGDGRARRRLILGALLIVLAGSLIVAVFDGFAMVIIGRAMQGVGLGLIPTAMVVARHHFPVESATRLLALLSVTAGIGIGLGYPLTGLIAEHSNYHRAFWFAAGVVGFAFVAAFVTLPDDRDQPASTLDVPGALLFSVGLLALLTAVSQGNDWGWASPAIVALFAVAAITLTGWTRLESRVAIPLVVLSRLRERTVLITNFSATVSSVAMYLFLPVVVEFVQVQPAAGYGFGASAALAGLSLLPMSLATAATSSIVPWALRRLGPRRMLPLGQVLLSGALLFFALDHADLWTAFVAMGISGVGIGLSFGAMPSMIISSVPRGESGSAMGLYQVLRTTGFAVGSALCAAVLAASSRPHHTEPRLIGYEAVLMIGAALCLVAALLALLLPPRAARPEPGLEAGLRATGEALA